MKTRIFRVLPLATFPAWSNRGSLARHSFGLFEADVFPATRETKLLVGDSILVVGTPGGLRQFEHVVGRASPENLIETAGAVTYRRVVVTNIDVLGKSIEELDLELKYGVVVTQLREAIWK